MSSMIIVADGLMSYIMIVFYTNVVTFNLIRNFLMWFNKISSNNVKSSYTPPTFKWKQMCEEIEAKGSRYSSQNNAAFTRARALINEGLAPIKEGDKYSPRATLAAFAALAPENRDVVKFVSAANDKPSSVVNPKMDSTWIRYTPFIMYMMKNKYDIQYSEWDMECPAAIFICGHYLLEAHKWAQKATDIMYNGVSLGDMSMADLANARHAAMDKAQGPTGFKCYTPGFTYSTDAESGLSLPQDILRMSMQLWFCHASKRQAGVHVLNPIDWDNVPESLDVNIGTMSVHTKDEYSY